MQKNGNHNKQSLRTQCNQIRTQNSETNSEPHNFMQTEQLALQNSESNSEPQNFMENEHGS